MILDAGASGKSTAGLRRGAVLTRCRLTPWLVLVLLQDTLVKEKGYTPEAPAGLIPAFKTGLTPEAELINGRLAMFGLMALVWGSFGTGTPILDCINIGLGRILY